MRVAAYIIHLERARERAAQVAELRAALPIPSEVLQAVDASAGDTTLGDGYDPARGWRPRYPFPLSQTEVAVFLSHRKTWERIVADGLDAGLVLEDDVRLEPELFPAAFDLAVAHLEDGQIVRFPRADRETGAVLAEVGDVRLIRPTVVGLGMQALLVHRRAAERMLAVTERFDRPVDVVLQMTWKTGVEVLAVTPAPVREVAAVLGGSTQKKRRGLGAKLRAEVARAIYRQRIARLSRQRPH